MKQSRYLLALFCVFLVFLPLVGLGLLILFPPPDPWGMPLPTWYDLIISQSLGTLLLNSILLSTTVALFALLCGGYLAWLEHRYNYRGSRILHTIGLLPLAMPSYILAASLSQSLGPSGWFGSIFSFEKPSGFFPALLSLGIVTIPYVQLSIGAALKKCSAAEEESALLLHKNSFQRFRVAIWPYIRPAAAFSTLIAFLYAISDFGAVATLNLPVLTWTLYESIRASDLRSASLLGSALLISTIPILLLAQSIAQQSTVKGGVANPRQRPKQPLPKNQLLFCYSLHATVIGFGLLFPIISMFDWVYEGWERGLSFASPWVPIRDTIILSSAGALFTIIFAAAPSWRRHEIKKGNGFLYLVISRAPFLVYSSLLD